MKKILLLCFLTGGFPSLAQEIMKPVKYSLFNPVPADKMRAMQRDRPDVTESAYTVDAGHFQLESDLFKHSRNHDGPVTNLDNIYVGGNYKLGLTESIDIQLVFPVFITSKQLERSSGQTLKKKMGFDDLTLRVKLNLWGNNGGKTAFALLPFISLPTSTFAENGVQGGIAFPLSVGISDNLDLGTQAGISVMKEADDRYHTEFMYSLTVGTALIKDLEGFAESAVYYNSFQRRADVYANGGLTLSFGENFNIDAGFNFGITRGSDKVWFTGLSFRL